MPRLNERPADPAANGAPAAAPRRAADAAPPWRRMLLSKRAAAGLLNLSPASFDRLRSAGGLPRPVEFTVGASLRWRRRDLLLWVRWGCPPLAEFEARLKSDK